MSNDELHGLIQALNNKTTVRLFLRPISKEVDWAIYFMQGPEAGKRCPREFFYFIKEPSGQYIGAVEDRGLFDLHWFIDPKFRKKGHLTSAMRTTIFPHIKSVLGRDFQKISINKKLPDFESSEKVALTLGFKKISEDSQSFIYELLLDDYRSDDCTGIDVPLSVDRKKEIYNTIGSITATLDLLSAEIKMSEGWIDEVDEIDHVANQVNNLYMFLYEWQLSCKKQV